MIFLILAVTYHSAFEIGITPYDNMHVYLPEFWSEVAGNKVQGYCDMEGMVDIGKFSIGGGMKTFYGKSTRERPEFVPYKITYRFLAELHIHNFNIGFRHYCIHPVVPYVSFDSPTIFKGAYEELYIRFEN